MSRSTEGIELRIREFEEGKDERAWIELFNAYFGHYYGREFEPLDEDDVEWFKNSPWWRDSKVFLAEVSGEPVGIIRPVVDRQREPPKGYIWGFAVKPELEGSEVDRQLLRKAVEWLISQGARAVQANVRDNMEARIRLYEGEGFRLVRSFSVMRLRPQDLRDDVEPNRQVKLRKADPLKNEDDLRTLNMLENEAFSEHFDFRPSSLEETRAFLEHEGYEDLVLFAYLADRPVGFVIASVSKDLPELEFKKGIIMEVGVLKPYRRKGIGTALMLEAINWIWSKGAEVVELSVDDDNPTGAPAFYARLGFRRAFRTLVYLREF